MPFIKQHRRNQIAQNALTDWEPGDRCYVFYQKLMDAWRESPRWTTVHNIYRSFIEQTITLEDDDAIALRLAWEVFFALVVIPYELKKREENGDI